MTPSTSGCALSHTSTPSGKRMVAGVRVNARTFAPLAAGSATSGRPRLPVARVIGIIVFPLLFGVFAGQLI
ncbi:hypothetical protein [Streptomyces sp. NPDC047009]|uniref:hypothetical protein n=1 Tax=Streptomyces sp. NPDC047009 TaxID=3154496 RepID=UPI0033FBEED8